MITLHKQRIPLEAALANIATAQPLLANSEGEGWALFNLPDTPTSNPRDYLTTSIERLDEAATFENDSEAVAYVIGQAEQGSEPHTAALIIEGACNSIRALLWGEEWVDSRIGPIAAQINRQKEYGTMTEADKVQRIGGAVSKLAQELRDEDRWTDANRLIDTFAKLPTSSMARLYDIIEQDA